MPSTLPPIAHRQGAAALPPPGPPSPSLQPVASADGVRYDPYAIVADALASSSGRAAAAAQGSRDAALAARLLVVCFVDRWAPPAHATALAVEAVRTGREVGFAQLFVVDAADEREQAWEAGVVTTPSLRFYWEGDAVLLRRPDWEDGLMFVGALSAERLLEVCRHARECCEEGATEGGRRVLSLDF